MRLRDRRTFDVLKLLGEQTGSGLMLVAGSGADAMPPGLTDSQRAMALAEAGNLALAAAIVTACYSPHAWRSERRVWREMTPDSGAAAAVFMAHGLAATTRRLGHLRSDRLDAARSLLRTHLPWSDEDETEIQGIVDSIEPGTLNGFDDAQVAVPFGALRRVIGKEAARSLPLIAEWLEGDRANRYVAGVAWQTCWANMCSPFLGLTDAGSP